MSEEEWRKRLQEAVDKSGKSMRAISLTAGCSASYLHGILKENKEPTLARLVKICSEIGVSVTYIILGIEMSPTHESLLLLMSDLPDAQQQLLLELARSLARDKG
jgi:transcriptional regulator with XRE-family HTH domain